MDILYFVNNRLCSKLILPATMSVKSNPFLTDLRWTWLGRVAKPTYSLSWSWKTDRNMTWWLSCNGPRRRIVDLGSLIKPTENNVKPSHKTKQRAKLRFPQKSWSNFLTLFDFFPTKENCIRSDLFSCNRTFSFYLVIVVRVKSTPRTLGPDGGR